MAQLSSFDEYQAATARISESLDRIKTSILEWVARNQDAPPVIREIAQLEALHAERARLTADLLAVEQRFMNHLISRLREITAGK